MAPNLRHYSDWAYSSRPVLRYHPGMDQIDIYRSAALLIEKHGEGAVIEAAIRADAMLDMGDQERQPGIILPQLKGPGPNIRNRYCFQDALVENNVCS